MDFIPEAANNCNFTDHAPIGSLHAVFDFQLLVTSEYPTLKLT
jgi:hypothetical protein